MRKLVYFGHPDELRIKANNDRDKEKYKIQPDTIKNLIEMYPNKLFEIHPDVIKVNVEGKIGVDELKRLLALKSPKFTGITIMYSSGEYTSSCYGDLVFEPITYYSDIGKLVEVRK